MRILRFTVLFYYSCRSLQGKAYPFRKIENLKHAFSFSYKNSIPMCYKMMMKLIRMKKNAS